MCLNQSGADRSHGRELAVKQAVNYRILSIKRGPPKLLEQGITYKVQWAHKMNVVIMKFRILKPHL